METIGINSTGAAVEDVQRRLIKLGFDIGEEGIDGIYLKKTANAVREFRRSIGLPDDNCIDSVAWAGLVDASFSLGDRMLYLRMPYFHGNDVRELQQILLVLGFSCGPVDSIFGAHTEKAVRDFQINMGLEPDGIVGVSTQKALLRLHHAWKGKDPMPDGGAAWGFSRAAASLESTPICFYGTDDATREVAQAISNLAFATTVASKVVSAQAMSGIPDSNMLMIGLTSAEDDYQSGVPLIIFDGFDSLVRRLKAAVSHSPKPKRIVIRIDFDDEASFCGEYTASDISDAPNLVLIQHFAVMILDAICRVF